MATTHAESRSIARGVLDADKAKRIATANDQWKVIDGEDFEYFTGTEAECEAYCNSMGWGFNRWICQRRLMLCYA